MRDGRHGTGRDIAWAAFARLLVVLVSALSAAPCLAQVIPPLTHLGPGQTTPISEKIAELKLIDPADDATKAAIELYERALAEQQSASAFDEQRAQFERESGAAPGQLTQLQSEAVTGLGEPPPDLTVQELESLVSQGDAKLKAQRDQLAMLSKEPENRARLRTQVIPDRLAELGTEEAALRSAMQQPLPAELPAVVREATVQLQHSTLARVIAEREALSGQLVSIDARRDLLSRQIDRETQRTQLIEQDVQALRASLDEKRREQASDLESRANKAAQAVSERLPEELHALAQRNAAMARERSDPGGVLVRLREAQEAQTQHARTLQATIDRREVLYERVKHSGRRAIGLMLRSELEGLPDLRGLEGVRQRFNPVYQDSLYQGIDLQEELDAYRERQNSYEQRLSAAVEKAEAELGAIEAADIRRTGREVLDTHRDLLLTLIDEHAAIVGEIERLFATATQLGDVTREVREFIKERILWVKSIRGTVPLPVPADAAEGARWLVLSDDAGPGLRRVFESFGADPAPVVLWLLLAGLVVPVVGVFAHRLRARVTEHVKKFSTDRFAYTPLATMCSVVLAARVPVALYAGAQVLVSGSMTPEVLLAWSRGLEAAAVHVFFISCVLELLRRGGVADVHYRWPTGAVLAARGRLRAFLWPTAALVFVTFALAGQPRPEFDDSLGRLAFIALMGCGTAVTWWLCSRTSPPIVEYVKRHRGGLISRTYWLWFPALVLLPALFIVLSLAGYYYTAVQLSMRYALTAWLIAALLVLNATLLRWLFLERRRLAVARLQEKRAAAEAGEGDGKGPEAVTDESQLDLPAINAQTRQLIQSLMAVLIGIAVFAAWADVLPALRVLQRVQLYPEVRYIGIGERAYSSVAAPLEQGVGETSDASGDRQDPPAEEDPAEETLSTVTGAPSSDSARELADEPQATLTLFGLGVAVLAAVLTWVAMANLTGLLEITILNRLPVDVGVKYAVTTLARYILLFIGVGVVAGTLGLEWSKLQWLVAALTVGLGFGLQEIVANFVSGIIILFERPIRVGDTITIGDQAGIVTKIRMRATTVLCGDQRELIVPNKSFITGNVLNATLSNTRMRLILNVGIAYGSDVPRAVALLRDIVDRHPLVLRDPAPMVLFTGLGESTLDLQVWVYMGTADHFLTMRHELLMQIDAAFREASIEIAFPQRDVHIRSMPRGFGVGGGPEAQPGPGAIGR